MSITLQSTYNAMVREFTSSTADRLFKADFTAAANRSFDALSEAADLDTPIAHQSATDAPVSELNADDSSILHDCLVWELTSGGRKHVADDAKIARDNYEDALGRFMVKKSLADQKAVDSDGVPTADIVGLGYLGDE